METHVANYLEIYEIMIKKNYVKILHENHYKNDEMIYVRFFVFRSLDDFS